MHEAELGGEERVVSEADTGLPPGEAEVVATQQLIYNFAVGLRVTKKVVSSEDPAQQPGTDLWHE